MTEECAKLPLSRLMALKYSQPNIDLIQSLFQVVSNYFANFTIYIFLINSEFKLFLAVKFNFLPENEREK